MLNSEKAQKVEGHMAHLIAAKQLKFPPFGHQVATDLLLVFPKSQMLKLHNLIQTGVGASVSPPRAR